MHFLNKYFFPASALLDVLLFGRLYQFLHSLNFSTNMEDWWLTLLSILDIIFIFSLLASAYGWILRRNWVFWIYYAQLPLRVAFFSFSFYFVWEYIPLGQSPIPFIVLGFLEICRTIVTVCVQRSHNN